MSKKGSLSSTPPVANDLIANISAYYYYYEVDDMYHLTGSIDKYAIPVIFTFGIPANLIAALVFMNKTFRQTSFGVNLIGKSLSDTVFLVCAFIVWLERVEVNLLHKPGICQGVVYLTYVSAFTSVWFVVALAMENLIRIRYPYRVGTICQSHKACVSITIMVVVAGVLYFPTLWINSVDDIEGLGVCQRNHAMTLVSSVYAYIDSLLTLIIPFGLVTVFLVMTIETVCTSKARSLRMFHHLRVSLSVMMQQQITRMLSAVSIGFVILTFPSHVTRIILLVIVWNYGIADISPQQYLTQHVFQLFYYLSFAINLLIYAVFCPKVRASIMQGAKLCPMLITDQASDAMSHSVILTDHTLTGCVHSQNAQGVNLQMEVRMKQMENNYVSSVISSEASDSVCSAEQV